MRLTNRALADGLDIHPHLLLAQTVCSAEIKIEELVKVAVRHIAERRLRDDKLLLGGVVFTDGREFGAKYAKANPHYDY